MKSPVSGLEKQEQQKTRPITLCYPFHFPFFDNNGNNGYLIIDPLTHVLSLNETQTSTCCLLPKSRPRNRKKNENEFQKHISRLGIVHKSGWSIESGVCAQLQTTHFFLLFIFTKSHRRAIDFHQQNTSNVCVHVWCAAHTQRVDGPHSFCPSHFYSCRKLKNMKNTAEDDDDDDGEKHTLAHSRRQPHLPGILLYYIYALL